MRTVHIFMCNMQAREQGMSDGVVRTGSIPVENHNLLVGGLQLTFPREARKYM